VTSAVSVDKGTAKLKSVSLTESPEEEEAGAALSTATARGKNQASLSVEPTKLIDTFQGMVW
jgi:uncharacterized protein YggE